MSTRKKPFNDYEGTKIGVVYLKNHLAKEQLHKDVVAAPIHAMTHGYCQFIPILNMHTVVSENVYVFYQHPLHQMVSMHHLPIKGH